MEVGVKNKAFPFWKPSKGNVLFCSRRHLTWAISRHEFKSSSMPNIHSFSPFGRAMQLFPPENCPPNVCMEVSALRGLQIKSRFSLRIEMECSPKALLV